MSPVWRSWDLQRCQHPTGMAYQTHRTIPPSRRMGTESMIKASGISSSSSHEEGIRIQWLRDERDLIHSSCFLNLTNSFITIRPAWESSKSNDRVVTSIRGRDKSLSYSLQLQAAKYKREIPISPYQSRFLHNILLFIFALPHRKTVGRFWAELRL